MAELQKKLLLHTCCAPCACGCLEKLEGREITLFFSNSNLNSREEYEKRLENVRIFAERFSFPLLIDPYDHQAWLEQVSGIPDYENAPERGIRCGACFKFSLGRTAKAAEKLDMNFATTLTVSPHKNSKLIFSIGAECSPRFEPIDFKKNDGFLKSLRLSRELGLYRQDFCGCEFSRQNRKDNL